MVWYGLVWIGMVGHDGHGWPSLAMVGCGLQWLAMVGHGWPWLAMVGQG